MTQHQDIQRIIDQAKQQRAEYIGSAIKRNAVPIVVAAGLSLVLLQFVSDPAAEHVAKSQVVNSADWDDVRGTSRRTIL